MNEDPIVKVKKSDLAGLIDATVEAYNLLDEAKAELNSAIEKVEKAYSVLEEAPAEISDVIVEDEDDSEDKD